MKKRTKGPEHRRPMSAFAHLCAVADRHDLDVEIVQNPNGERAIWVVPAPRKAKAFSVGGVEATMRVAVVGSPFMADPPYEGLAPQLIQMLAARGYSL